MNKDALLATVIGFGVGLVIAALVFFGPTVFSRFPTIRLPNLSFLSSIFKSNSTQTTPSPTPKASDALTIDSPLPDATEPNDEPLISGKTEPNAMIVIEGESEERVVTANSEGSYAGKILLKEGKNEIFVTSYGKNSQTTSVVVFFTPEDF